jgi:glycine cleavage system H protein
VFPGIYDFHWDAGHIIFLGIFYSVLVVVMSTIAIAARRAVRDFHAQRAEALRWHADFEDLPAKWRRCRHELAGEVDERTCPNAFDCRHCLDHPRFVAARSTPRPLGEPRVAGFEIPADRLYHRGHTWVRLEPDGLLTVGLDDLGAHLMGEPDELQLPRLGTRLVANGTGWHAEKNGVHVRVLAPVDGEVVGLGGAEKGWYLKIKPDGDRADTRHLLTASEAKPWMLREVERLHLAMASEGVGAALADGGVPVEDLSTAIPPEQRDDVYGMVFLNG